MELKVNLESMVYLELLAQVECLEVMVFLGRKVVQEKMENLEKTERMGKLVYLECLVNLVWQVQPSPRPA